MPLSAAHKQRLFILNQTICDPQMNCATKSFHQKIPQGYETCIFTWMCSPYVIYFSILFPKLQAQSVVTGHIFNRTLKQRIRIQTR